MILKLKQNTLKIRKIYKNVSSIFSHFSTGSKSEKLYHSSPPKNVEKSHHLE